MRIFLDVDDTLADFRGHAIARGVPSWAGTWYTKDPSEWTEEQHLIQKQTTDQMCRQDFWLNMPLVEGAFELIAAAGAAADVFLLTAMPFHIKCQDTRDMIRRAKRTYAVDRLHFPSSRVIICERPEKVRYAFDTLRNCSSLLVDDATQNCDEWRQHGGLAILHRSIGESVRALKDVLEA